MLGGAYAWNSNDQYKTSELSSAFKNNDVTLVENFTPISDWAAGQKVDNAISVKNNTTKAKGDNAYIRISLKEFLEFTNTTETLSTVRYAVNANGDFAKFDSETDAQAYATTNGLDKPVQIAQTAFEGANKWFIPTKGGASHGQYGKFLVLSIGDGTSKSIIDPAVAKVVPGNHQGATPAEDAYTTQKFDATGNEVGGNARNYSQQVKDYPAAGTIKTDLKDYITWQFGADVTTLDHWKNSAQAGKPTAKWIIDTAKGYAYWGDALAPETATANFLDSVTLTQPFKDTSLYYVIHTKLEAVDYNELDTINDLPAEMKAVWKYKTPPTPPTPSVPALNVPNTTAGSEFTFAGSKWRILKEDMNNDAKDGKQALIIKVDALTNGESGQAGTATDVAEVKFHETQTTYFDATGQNGYETSNLKTLIDYYYKNTIAKSADSQYVLGVDLNNPTFAQFLQGITLNSGTGVYDDWLWGVWQTERRFATTLNNQGAKQAFALSYGDIYANQLNDDNISLMSNLLVGLNTPKYLWMRSPGIHQNAAGHINAGSFKVSSYLYVELSICPALALQIK
jgi:hypothetical protein